MEEDNDEHTEEGGNHGGGRHHCGGGIRRPRSGRGHQAGLMLKKGFPGAEPVNGMFELFESEVEKGSSGAIEMEIVYGGALGKPNERLNHVRHGIIQMSDASDGNYASIYKDIQILSMPYLFPDEETAWKLLDGPIGTAMAEDIREKTGIRVLGWWSPAASSTTARTAPSAPPTT